MRRTIAAVGAAAAAGLAVGAALAPSARAATPASASATAALRYLYGGQGTDGSIAGSAGPTEDTVIGTADNGYDPATLQRTGGTSAIAYLAGLVSAGKVTTGGATAKLILAWVAAGKPAAIDGAALLARLDGAATGGGLLQPGGTFHATDAAVETANTFTQALAVLANVAMEHALPANATGWLVCAARSDGGFGYAITDTAASPPASCGDTSSD
ncbi:MAG TPA: hypothetical protein VFO60_02170, partial [Candidatus Dormibacteraeota bacterium]|nr:hypothetical protein [Candidatus Dormibacteraeota bacterium]